MSKTTNHSSLVPFEKKNTLILKRTQNKELASKKLQKLEQLHQIETLIQSFFFLFFWCILRYFKF